MKIKFCNYICCKNQFSISCIHRIRFSFAVVIKVQMLNKRSQKSSRISKIMMMAMPVKRPREPPSAEISPEVCNEQIRLQHTQVDNTPQKIYLASWQQSYVLQNELRPVLPSSVALYTPTILQPQVQISHRNKKKWKRTLLTNILLLID